MNIEQVLANDLNTEQKEALLDLIAACRTFDGISFSLPDFDDPELMIYMAYHDRILAGALFLIPCEKTALADAYTLPAFRRQGIFRNLISKARKTAPDTALSFTISPECETAYGILCKCGAKKHQTDYLLTYELPEDVTPGAALALVPSGDKGLLASLHHQIFDFPLRASDIYVENMLAEENLYGFLLRQENKDHAGLCFLLADTKTLHLCGFGILPALQGTGLGYAALQSICHYAISEYPDVKTLAVQVSDTNIPAFELYKKYGFTIRDSVTEYIM